MSKMSKQVEQDKLFGVFMTPQEIQKYYEGKGFTVVPKPLRSGTAVPAVVLPERLVAEPGDEATYWIVPELWRVDARGDLIDPLKPYRFDLGEEEEVWDSVKRNDIRGYATVRSVQYGGDGETFVIVPPDQATHLYFSDWVDERYYCNCSVCEVVRVGKTQKTLLDLASRDLANLQLNMEQHQLYAEKAPKFAEIMRSQRPAAEQYGLLLDFDRYPNKAVGYELGSEIVRSYRDFFQSYDQLTDTTKRQIEDGRFKSHIFYYDQSGVDALLEYCARKLRYRIRFT